MNNELLLYFIILIIVLILFLINYNLKIPHSLIRITADGSSQLRPTSIIKALGLELLIHLPFTERASPYWGPLGGPEGAGWDMLQHNSIFVIMVYSIIYWSLIYYYHNNKSQIIKTTQTKNKIKIDNAKTEKIEKKNNIKTEKIEKSEKTEKIEIKNNIKIENNKDKK